MDELNSPSSEDIEKMLEELERMNAKAEEIYQRKMRLRRKGIFIPLSDN